MRRFAALLFLVVVLPAAAQEPLPLPKKTIVPDKIAARAGDIITIAPEGKNSFVWDELAFPGKRADLDAGKLRLTTPYNGKYVVTVIQLPEGTKNKVEITVTGGLDAPPDPPEPPSPETFPMAFKALTKIVSDGFAAQAAFNAKTDARLAALEGKEPPTPTMKAKSLTFVVFNITPATQSVTENAEFLTWVKSQGILTFGIYSKAELDRNPRFVGITAPSLVMQDTNNNVMSSVAMTDVAAAKTFVLKCLGK
jgi:hypothetical protein